MIGIVTVNWNGYEVTHNLVKQILENTYQDFRLIVVNNSPDDKSKFDQDPYFTDHRIEMIHSPINAGYSGGLNLGMKTLLLSPQISHFLLLNNDVVIEKEFIDQLLCLGKDENKIYAPLILYQDTDLVQNTGGNIYIWLGGGMNLNKNVPVTKIHKSQPDFLSGCILFMRREIIEKVGLFDEVFGSYFEDTDYCFRAKAIGIDLEILWGIQARHFHSYSTQGNKNYKVYLLNRNQIIFAKKHLSPIPRIVFITAAIVRGFLFNLFSNRFSNYLKGVKEGLEC
jgi:GT2 family glycosyltransferase